MKTPEEIKKGLRQLMQTKNEVTVPLSGTGSAGMEAAFVNLVEPGIRSWYWRTAFSATGWRM